MRHRYPPLLALLFILSGCHPKLDVYAPERELYVVYCVLNPNNAEQYISITKVFQYEGDAEVYAAENDLTARGMNVEISTDSTTWQADLIEIPDSQPGLFARTTGIYRIATPPGNALKPGYRHYLHITKPQDTNFHINAYTDVPTRPRLTSPGDPIYSVQQGTFTLETYEFSEDVGIYFRRGSGVGFELRLYAQYFNGTAYKIAQWGPTHIFRDPQNCHAHVDAGESCYEIPELSVPNALHAIFAKEQDTVYLFDTIKVAYSLDSLNRNVWMEVTAVDSFLTSFLYTNLPFGFGLNLLMDKEDFTNIGGGNAGIFGSINTDKKYLFLGACTRYLSGLRGTKPPGCGN
jgi:hypothetical protein